MCIKICKIICQFSSFNSSELDNLFKTVYNDLICNYRRKFNKILMKNNRIKSTYVHKCLSYKSIILNII